MNINANNQPFFFKLGIVGCNIIVLILFLVKECIKWHQTENCDPNGLREPLQDKSCETIITSFSGYCLCSNGQKAMSKGCYGPEHYGYTYNTCQEACRAKAKGINAYTITPIPIKMIYFL